MQQNLMRKATLYAKTVQKVISALNVELLLLLNALWATTAMIIPKLETLVLMLALLVLTQAPSQLNQSMIARLVLQVIIVLKHQLYLRNALLELIIPQQDK